MAKPEITGIAPFFIVKSVTASSASSGGMRR